MHPEDVETIARPADSLRPIVTLFSTVSAAEAVCLTFEKEFFGNSIPWTFWELLNLLPGGGSG
jgi:hypothetical protein